MTDNTKNDESRGEFITEFCDVCRKPMANSDDEGIHNTGECGCPSSRALCWRKFCGECMSTHCQTPAKPVSMPSPERLREILTTLRMFNNAEKQTLYDYDVVEEETEVSADEPFEDILYSNWPYFVRSLRHAAEISSYVPNAMRWEQMADELLTWVENNPQRDG